MKKTICMILLVLFVFSSIAHADTWVNGYTRSDGTFVQGHWRSSPNSTKADNFGPSRSSVEDSNPYMRDHDNDGLANTYDYDDDNDGISDDYDSSQYGW